jgi:hypothetical protein
MRRRKPKEEHMGLLHMKFRQATYPLSLKEITRRGRPSRDFWLSANSDFVVLEKMKITFTSFQKIEKKSDVANDLSHKCANYQFQILCISCYTRMKNVWI